MGELAADLKQRWLPLLLLVPIAWLLWHQAQTLAYPIIGEHGWRQADVYAAAHNFRHESADFFRPRIDWTDAYDGVMGMEPPILAYAIAGAMALFGDDPAVARSTAWLLCVIAGGLAWWLAAALHGRLFATLLVLCLLVTPLGLFEPRQIQPDAAMALWALVAALLLSRAGRHGRRRDYLLGLGAFTFAVLLKGPAIVLGPAMLLFTFSATARDARHLLARSLPFALPCLLLLAWWWWADRLNATHSPGRAYFAMSASPAQVRENLTHAGRLKHIFFTLYPSYVASQWLLPLTGLGLLTGLSRERRAHTLGWLTWLLCASLLAAAFSSKLRSHWYYADLAWPPLAYFTASGIAWLAAALGEARSGPALARLSLLVLALAAVPVAGQASQRALSRRSDARYAEGHRAVLAPLRAAVARYTTRQDKILVNGRDPVALHDAMRKGFTHSLRYIGKRKLAYFAKRGAVIYVHRSWSKKLPQELRDEQTRYRLLEKARKLRIYCLQRRCPRLEGRPDAEVQALRASRGGPA